MLQVSCDIETEFIVEYPVEERFIKLPIERYLEVLEITPNKPQIAIVNAINDSRYRFIVACISRRLGKTYISNIIGNLVCLYPNSHVLIISPNYNLSSISWEVQQSFLKKFDIALVRSNAKDRIMELENGSTIRMGSISQVDSVVGRSYDLIIFDESALSNGGRDAFNVQLRPTLDKPNSKAIFISTPRGKNFFFDFFNYGGVLDEWISIKADWTENDRASEKDINNAALTMSNAEWRQEYYAEFTVMQGKIYNLPAECIVSKDVVGVPSYSGIGKQLVRQDVIIGIDLGFRDPTAIVVGVTDGYSWHIIDCWEDNGKTTSQYAQVLQDYVDKYDVDFVYIDSANQQMKYDFAVEYDIFCINAKKDVLLGLGYCQGLVENSLVTIDPSCTKLIEVMGYYAWDLRPGLTKEKPIHDKHSHTADAFRYMMYSHSHAVVPQAIDV